MGQHIDISMTDCMFAMNGIFGSQFLAAGQKLSHESTHINGGSFYGYYLTKDKKVLSVGSLEPKFLTKLCNLLKISEHLNIAFSDDPENQRNFKQIIAKKISEKKLSEWEDIFSSEDVCVEPVLSFEDACSNDQLVSRQMITSVAHLDGTEEKQVGSAIKFSETKPRYDYCGAELGYHTEETLRSLNYSDAEIASMLSKGEIN